MTLLVFSRPSIERIGSGRSSIAGIITLTLYGGVELPEVVLGGRIALAVDDIQKAHEELKGKGVD